MTVASSVVLPHQGETPAVRFLAALVLCVIVFQANFSLGSLLLSPARLVFLVSVPVLLLQLLSGRFGPLTLVDALIFSHISWLTMTMFINHSAGIALTYTGSNIVLILGGYLAGRCLVRSVAEMRGMILVLLTLVLFTLPFALLEARSSSMVLARLIDTLPGLSGNRDVNYEGRLGLERVQVLFAHPIHYGLFASCAFAMCFVGLRGYLRSLTRWVLSIGVGLATFLSISSGPFLSLGGQLFLIGWGALFHRLPKKWRLLGGIALALYLILEVLSNRPAIYVIVSKLAFAPHTANLRLLLFEYGSAQIWRAPVFGIGANPFPLPHFMTGSIDNHWLLLCITFGLPTFLLLWGALIVMFIRLGRISGASQAFNDLRLAWNITLISLMLTLATVAIWTEMLSLFYFVIGTGVWMTLHTPETAITPDHSEPVPHRGGPVYSRFATRPGPNAGGDTLASKPSSRAAPYSTARTFSSLSPTRPQRK